MNSLVFTTLYKISDLIIREIYFFSFLGEGGVGKDGVSGFNKICIYNNQIRFGG